MIETLSTAAAPFEVSFLKARVRHTSREPYPLDLMRTAAGLQLFFLRAQHHNALIGDTIEVDVSLSMPTGEAREARAYVDRSEEHTSELQSLMRISYAVFCLKKKTTTTLNTMIHSSDI